MSPIHATPVLWGVHGSVGKVALTPDTPLVQALGERTDKALKKAFGYTTVGDFLEHFPRRYASRGELTSLQGIPLGESVSIVAEVVSCTERPMRKRRGSLLEVEITDGTGLITITFFNQAWRSRDLQPGARGIFAGKVGAYRGGKQLSHPDYELFDDQPPSEHESKAWAETPIPIYPATAQMASWQIQKAMASVLSRMETLDDPLPEVVRENNALLPYHQAIVQVHQPSATGEWKAARATLRFHEALLLQLALLRQRDEMRSHGATVRTAGALTKRFHEALPFTLTSDQEAVITEIDNDLVSGIPMHRLVQGEVGSGKTVVAVRATVQVAEDGGQTALLAPTEVLASQHLRSIVKTLGPDLAADLVPTLLTGGLGAQERKRAELKVVSGQARIVVGTHALLNEKLAFHDLGLVVIDEQHRFGVGQRDVLRQKGTNPHVLILTATPIPRTVAMTVFGDVDVSTIRGVPEGRQPISTHVVSLSEHPDWFGRVWSRAEEEIAQGRQVFVVCSAIDKADADPDAAEDDVPVTGVEELAAQLRTHPQLGARRIGIVHGRLDSDEKDRVMTQFQNGELDVLVATTVIEVGVDVPQASTMIVMDADRFGISQLHQLRGRVGRGELPGVCLLVTHVHPETVARQRLDAVASTTDGFELARIDMELRREGDVLGSSQSGGRSGLKLLRVSTDGDLIEAARHQARDLLDDSADLSQYPSLQRAVDELLAGQEADYLDRS